MKWNVLNKIVSQKKNTVVGVVEGKQEEKVGKMK